MFEQYNSFGGKKDAANMDGRTFAKFCKVRSCCIAQAAAGSAVHERQCPGRHV